MRRTELETVRMELGGHLAGALRALDALEAAAPVEPRALDDEHKDLGYAVERIEGAHDGYGNEYVRVTWGGETLLDGRDRVSADASGWINGFVAGHARAMAP